MVKKRKKFGKITYTLQSSHEKKSTAKDKAKAAKRSGDRARVVKGKKHKKTIYRLYVKAGTRD